MPQNTSESTSTVLETHEGLIKTANELARDLETAEKLDGIFGSEEAADDAFHEAIIADTLYGYTGEDSLSLEKKLNTVRSQIDVLYLESKNDIHVAALDENAAREEAKQ
jgi:hypothetical protein